MSDVPEIYIVDCRCSRITPVFSSSTNLHTQGRAGRQAGRQAGIEGQK